MAQGIFGGFVPYRTEGFANACKQFFQKKRGLPRFKKKNKAKKDFAVDVSGGKGVQRMDMFGESGGPCEDDAILSSEPLRKPSAQICPHF